MPSNAGRPFLVSAISTHHHIRLRRGFQSLCSLASISLPFDDPLSEKEVRGIIHVTSTESFSHPLRNFIQPILPCFLILSSLGYPSPNPMQTSRVNGPRDNAPSLFDRTKSPFPSTNRFSAVRSFVRSFVPLLRLRSDRVSEDGTWLPLSPLAAPPTPRLHRPQSKSLPYPHACNVDAV